MAQRHESMSKTKKAAKKAVVKKVARKPAAKVSAKPAKTDKTAAKKAVSKKPAPKKAAPVVTKVHAPKKAAKPAPVQEVKKIKKPMPKAPEPKEAVPKKTIEAKVAKPVIKPEAKEIKKAKPRPEPEESVEDVAVEVAVTEPEEEGEVVLTDAEGRRYCRVKDCDQLSMVEGYCRYHYLMFWKKIQVRKKILSEGKLERYVDELTSRYPDKYLEMIRKDLKTEKDFVAAIQELEIDDSGVDNEYEDEAQSFIEEVRGISSESGARDDDEF